MTRTETAIMLFVAAVGSVVLIPLLRLWGDLWTLQAILSQIPTYGVWQWVDVGPIRVDLPLAAAFSTGISTFLAAWIGLVAYRLTRLRGR